MVNGNSFSAKNDEAGKTLNTTAHQTKEIIQHLEALVPAFETASIGSDDYRDKAMLIHQRVRALAQLHPNWDDEKKIILNQQKHDAPPLDEHDPFVIIYEASEILFRSWHQMRVPEPSMKTLLHGGRIFRAALAKLHEETEELTNRKACRHDEHEDSSITLVINLSQSRD